MTTGVWVRIAGAVLVCSLAGMPFVSVRAMAQAPLCAAPVDATALDHPPMRVRERIARGQPIKIVAIGSSSTAGWGASSSDKSYPAQLAAELKARFPGLPVTVLNKGIGGEEAGQMLERFEADVIEENPDLVLWQVGSNSVLYGHPAPGNILLRGVGLLKKNGFDVILVNPQYAPKLLARLDAVQHAVDVIATTAREMRVGVFNRFRTMRYWREVEKLPFDQFVTPDGLHMNDWGYGCIARLLADAIVDHARLPDATATATRAKPR